MITINNITDLDNKEIQLIHYNDIIYNTKY